MKASEVSFDARISEARAAWSACSDCDLEQMGAEYIGNLT